MNAAPELLVQSWFNTDRPLTLAALRGRVVVLAAFQVLCPQSISSGVPQARRIFETFAPSDVTVIDCVFVVLAQRDLPAAQAALERTYAAAQAKRTRRGRRPSSGP